MQPKHIFGLCNIKIPTSNPKGQIPNQDLMLGFPFQAAVSCWDSNPNNQPQTTRSEKWIQTAPNTFFTWLPECYEAWSPLAAGAAFGGELDDAAPPAALPELDDAAPPIVGSNEADRVHDTITGASQQFKIQCSTQELIHKCMQQLNGCKFRDM